MKFYTVFLLTLLTSCATSQVAMEELVKRYGNHSHGWRQPSGYMKENPEPLTEESLANGRKLYRNNCEPCHGTKGRGDGILAANMNPKPADFSAMRGDRSDFHIFLQISLGNGDMPGRQELSEKDRWDIVNYVRTLLAKPAPDLSL